MAIPQKVSERLTKETLRFQKILRRATDKDINEADTVIIVSDMLSDIFGFDKYAEITREYSIRNTYCDLAVKVERDVKYLIEVKSISIDLKENHLRQAVDYGAHEGIQWVVLTNGLRWLVYSIVLKKTVEYEKVFEIDFLEMNPRKPDAQELLFLLAKEGLRRNVISDYHERMQSLNLNVVSAILLSETCLNMIRRELRRMTPGLKVELSEIESILKNEIIKRSILDDACLADAQKRVKRSQNKSGSRSR